jgi:hypothetical protein
LNLLFPQRRGIYWLFEWLLPCQEGLCSMETEKHSHFTI